MPSILRKIAVDITKGLLPRIAEHDLSTERMKVCKECLHFRRLANQCDLCGCFLDLKTKLLEATCPEGKW